MRRPTVVERHLHLSGGERSLEHAGDVRRWGVPPDWLSTRATPARRRVWRVMDDSTRFLAIPVGVGLVIGIVVGAIVGGGTAIGLGIAVGIVVGAAVGGLLRAAGKPKS